MKQWEIIHESDDENGNPTCWFLEINHYKYGESVWICESDDGYNIEVNRGNEIEILMNCKSLKSAKRWVSINLK